MSEDDRGQPVDQLGDEDGGGGHDGTPAGSGACGAPLLAPPLPPPVVFDQRWCDVAFLHWPVDPASIERFMPPGCEPDCAAGVSYVGLVALTIREARLGRSLRLPFGDSFAEVNLRLYSLDRRGRRGVVFRSLDCSSLPVVAGARLAGVPYLWSRARAQPQPGSRVEYVVRRRPGSRPGALHLTLLLGESIEPTPLEEFLTNRFGMHRGRRGAIFLPVAHEPWPLRAAEVVHLSESLLGAAGIEPSGPMLRPLYSAGVHARFGRPSVALR